MRVCESFGVCLFAVLQLGGDFLGGGCFLSQSHPQSFAAGLFIICAIKVDPPTDPTDPTEPTAAPREERDG